MGIHPVHLRDYIICPCLELLNLRTDGTILLLLGTAAHESQLGYYLHQIVGPALGIYQMEPATHDDIIKKLLTGYSFLSTAVQSMLVPGGGEDQLVWNLRYATAMCALKYAFSPGGLPAQSDIETVAEVWKRNYNTPLGKGTVEEFIANYDRLVAPHVS